MPKSLNASYTGEENGNILHRAYELINGDRQKDYGKPWDNFGLLAEFFTSYSRKRWGVDIEFKRTDVVNFLELLKLSRACAEQPTEDTYVDIAGYAGLGADFAERQNTESFEAEAKSPDTSVATLTLRGKPSYTLDGKDVPASVFIGSHDDWNTEDAPHEQY